MRQYETYKDSEVKWIGNIPSHWDMKKIKFISSINDEVIPDNFEKNKEIEYVEISDVKESDGITSTTIYKYKDAPSRARRITKEGDIIVSTVRTYLKAIARINRPNLIVSTGFSVIRPKIDKDFVSYALFSDTFINKVVSKSVGVSYPAINSNEIANIKIAVPPIEEQKAIADYLDEKTAQIDGIIRAREEKLQLLDELKTSIITKAVTKGIKKSVETKNSGVAWIGTIPAHWESSILKRFLREPMKYGANESAESDNRDYPRYIRITDIDSEGNLKEETFKSLPMEKARDYLLEEGDVLFARSGATVGKTYIHKGDNLACYAGYLIKAKCNNNLLPEYLFLYTQTGAYENWKDSIFIQSTIRNIGADKYSYMPIIVPPINEQKEVITFVKRRIDIVNNNIAKAYREIELMKEYRSSLITEVVTGKRKVI